MKFKEVKVLINCEGDILTLVERIDDPQKEQLYIVGKVLQGRCKVITKTNVDQISLYLLNRISLLELFTMRSDEYYILEYQRKQEKVIFDEAFESILSTIECKDKHYYQLSQNMKLDDPFELLRILKRDYIHSFASVPVYEHKYSGQSFIEKYPHLFNKSALPGQHMETGIYTYAQLKELFFNSGKDEVLFKKPLNWNGNKILGIFRNHKMIGYIDDSSSNYNISRCEEQTYYRLIIDELRRSL